MRIFFAIFFILASFAATAAQNEQSPIVEKDISYKNWTLKDVRTGEDRDLRQMIAGKKLVIIVYFAPWCHGWRHDITFLRRFYKDYSSKGLEIIGVGEYSSVASMRSNLEANKVAFPVVYESDSQEDAKKTKHYRYRTLAGDFRNWGTPWYIFIDPSKVETKGDTLLKRTFLINGEMIETEGEKFIREKLGIPPSDDHRSSSSTEKQEACDTAGLEIKLKKQ
ncbi:MAG: TlpA family protein disulfide reductase [Acidobacteria bacterium]|nr:TlpA family protein disulfide reductase [Acidobacteriota bacterium]